MQNAAPPVRPLIALFIAVMTGGCVTATFVPTGMAYPARPDDCDAQVFTAGLPDRPFKEIGLIEGDGSGWKSDLADVIPALRAEACRAGGDALILQSAEHYTTGDTGLDDDHLYAVATVIRWVER